MKDSLKGKVVLVTGVGRKLGIGAGICREVAKYGGDVFFTYWHQYDQVSSPESVLCDAEDFSKELEVFGVRAMGTEIDLTNPDSSKELFETVKKEFGTPEVLINNACYDFEEPFVDLRSVIKFWYEIS